MIYKKLNLLKVIIFLLLQFYNLKLSQNMFLTKVKKSCRLKVITETNISMIKINTAKKLKSAIIIVNLTNQI